MDPPAGSVRKEPNGQVNDLPLRFFFVLHFVFVMVYYLFVKE